MLMNSQSKHIITGRITNRIRRIRKVNENEKYVNGFQRSRCVIYDFISCSKKIFTRIIRRYNNKYTAD